MRRNLHHMAEALSDAAFGGVAEKDRMIAAFARTASTMAWEGPLQVVLDHLAEEVLAASGASTCAIMLGSRYGDSIEMVGAAGHPEGYFSRLDEARALGAPLATLRAYWTRTRVFRDIGELLTSDPRFEPLVDMTQAAGWTALVAIPLVVREEPVGVLTAFYAEGRNPSPSDISFLTAMADHGALAVNTARLVAEVKGKATLEERNRLARDMHDAVSQLLFSMRLRTSALQMAAEKLAPDSRQTMLNGLHELRLTIESAVEEMRALIFHLEPADLRDHDLVAALQRHAQDVSAREAAAVAVLASSTLPSLPRAVEQHIYRIAQEAIGNAVNHASASRIEVRLGSARREGLEYFVTEIADDGTGFEPARDRPGHMGLTNMRARAAELHGALTITSSATGTSIRLEVPVYPGTRGGVSR